MAQADRTRQRGAARLLPGARARARLAQVEAELEATRRALGRARAQITEASFDLPEDVERTIERVRREKLSFLRADQLRNLATLVRDLDATGVPGAIVEAGTARGGSGIVLAAAKARERPMKVYDVFGMIPPPSEHDGTDVHERYQAITAGQAKGLDGEVYYGYRTDLYAEVTESFRRLGFPAEKNNVELVQGLFEDTIHLDEPVAFAHVDGDWYESTMTCLERIAPRLSVGGRIVVDDYYGWSGCQRAVDEYFRGRPGFRLLRRRKLHVLREAD
ncbi:TylF/MycF/NovP-related O-methyltransferase [Nocardioides pantholopis]|uniref:TylF/MycF/NovP-related O-methyltransferase n=1 Tax=Nocardioides pantholopis TaxID=2483798 RepID=UPI000FD8930F|nr:TylF/MycF/NovP-related O-methyltransferase [Nocardioides pantholopis]